jgi:hypothetical protein
MKMQIFRRLLAMTSLVMLVAVGGCGASATTAADPDVARKTLETVLASWKEGGKPDEWQEKSPKVVVQDFDWAAGAKLKSFELLGPGELRDANLICKVKLVVEKPSQGAAERTVTYVVGTDPVLTVFRDSLQ